MIRRAFKRYLIDRIRLTILKRNDGDGTEIKDLVLEECPKELTLFVAQFSCGFVKKYEAYYTSGNVIKRKPDIGHAEDGKVYFIKEDDCTSKLKKWLKEESGQTNLGHIQYNL